MRPRPGSVLAGAALVLGATMACTSILGIEDVRLRRDGGPPPGDEFEEPGADVGPRRDVVNGDGPIVDSGGPNVVQVAQGYRHTCARKPDGTVWCWGDNGFGQLGDGIPFDSGDGARPDVLRPQLVPGLSDVTSVGAGDNHTCARKSDGTVWCWGYNFSGQVGNGQTLTNVPGPTQVAGLNDAIAVEAGLSFTCALRARGSVACWGANYYGQLGNGTKGGESTTPVAVSGLTDAVAIGLGDAHACAVRRGGGVVCWGANIDGQLGNGTSGSGTDTSVPTAVTGLNDATAVVGAGSSTCALRQGGAIACWGYNRYGQLGNGTSGSNPNPTPSSVAGIGDAIALGAGFLHICALRSTGIVSCWGRGADGQLGNNVVLNDASTPTATPVQVVGLNNAIGIGVGGGDHTCAPTATGNLLCWGRNDSGQLGDGNTSTAYSPVGAIGFP
jgi:alpha-tubulin suppressor-like RCC1 family protein